VEVPRQLPGGPSGQRGAPVDGHPAQGHLVVPEVQRLDTSSPRAEATKTCADRADTL
jgi:hypothetical protein